MDGIVVKRRCGWQGCNFNSDLQIWDAKSIP